MTQTIDKGQNRQLWAHCEHEISNIFWMILLSKWWIFIVHGDKNVSDNNELRNVCFLIWSLSYFYNYLSGEICLLQFLYAYTKEKRIIRLNLCIAIITVDKKTRITRTVNIYYPPCLFELLRPLNKIKKIVSRY